MPIYEYECKKCGATFETMQSVSAKPLKTCQGLGCANKDNGKVHRLVSTSGFILKGSGWYASDYPSEDRKKGWESEGKPTTSAPDEGNNTPAEKVAAPSTAAAPAAEKPVSTPVPKKTTQKNPYSGGKRSRTKASK